jgi:hypothetical protein
MHLNGREGEQSDGSGGGSGGWSDSEEKHTLQIKENQQARPPVFSTSVPSETIKTPHNVAKVREHTHTHTIGPVPNTPIATARF